MVYITNKGLDEVADREVQGGKDYNDHTYPLLVAVENQ